MKLISLHAGWMALMLVLVSCSIGIADVPTLSIPFCFRKHSFTRVESIEAPTVNAFGPFLWACAEARRQGFCRETAGSRCEKVVGPPAVADRCCGVRQTIF